MYHGGYVDIVGYDTQAHEWEKQMKSELQKID